MHAITPAAAAFVAALLVATNASAFDELNEAQTLIYDTPHLASMGAGDALDYRYRARLGEAGAIEDRARLVVDAAPESERRDVTLEFLSEARRMELPPFRAYRGNPVLIAMLEHVAQSLSASTGGGTLYFRNRIRDGLARESTTVERGERPFAGRPIEATTLAFAPFAGDAYLGARPGYGDATFTIVLSEAVPGGVVSISARAAEEAPAEARFDYELTLEEPGPSQ